MEGIPDDIPALIPPPYRPGLLVLGGVYMIPVRVSFWYEFILVLTYRSVFVYMIPVKNLIPVQLIPV